MCRPAADAHPFSLSVCGVVGFFLKKFSFIPFSLSLFALSGSIKVTSLCSPAPGQKAQRLLVVTLWLGGASKKKVTVRNKKTAGGLRGWRGILNNDSGHLLYRSRSTPLRGVCGVRRVSSRDTFSGINTFTSDLSRATSCCFTTLEGCRSRQK